MEKTKVIVVRHGQSVGNLYRSFLGWTDLDLSEMGYIQAQKLADFFENERIDVIYSSDLIRAYNTILPTAQKKQMDIIKDKELREIYAGEWENMKFADIPVKYPEDYKIWKEDIGNAVCTGGESVLELQERICGRVEQIARENMGKTVLISTHATPIRVMCAKWKGIGKDEIKDIPWVTNASATYAEYVDGVFKLTEYGKNDYLGDSVTYLPADA